MSPDTPLEPVTPGQRVIGPGTARTVAFYEKYENEKVSQMYEMYEE